MSYRRPDKLRQVAVLVASLDEPLAEALLGELPPVEAAEVRDLVAQLEEIDPEEQADVLDQLRRSTQMPATVYEDTVEIESTWADQLDRWSQATQPQPSPQDRFREQIAAADAAAIASRLEAEDPQIIAVALLRLPQEKAEAVFAALPTPVQSPVVERLANSTPASEAAVSELEAHLSQWIAQDLQLESHRAAGSDLVERLRRQMPAEKTVAAEQLLPATADPETQARRRRLWSSLEVVARGRRDRDAMSPSYASASHSDEPGTEQQADASSACEEPRYDPADLERIDDQTLLGVLCEAEPRQAQLALHAGSEELLRRVIRQAPRRVARKLRRQLGTLGPVSLRELDEAQQVLLRLARRRGAAVRVVAAASQTQSLN